MNIESRFKDIDDFSSFPNREDYVSKYNELAKVFNTRIHPEIKTKILALEKEGYYNDHGIEHINMVIDRATKIIDTFHKNESNFMLSPYETFLLLVAIHLHDAGHLIGKRAEHATKVHELLHRSCGKMLTAAEKRTIGDIAKAHGGKEDPIGKVVDEHISNIEIRSKLLAAILRLADELAEDKSRASLELLGLDDDLIDEPNTHIDKHSEIYHRFSESFDSIRLEGTEMKISFCVRKKNLKEEFERKKGEVVEKVFLLDEIYARTYKTFLETLYCNRFFPAKSRFDAIKVKIDLLTEFDETFRTISYTLKEEGYPLAEDISSLIHRQVKDGSHILSGAYIAKLINEEKHEKESVRS